jgi:hypothetical protein
MHTAVRMSKGQTERKRITYQNKEMQLVCCMNRIRSTTDAKGEGFSPELHRLQNRCKRGLWTGANARFSLVRYHLICNIILTRLTRKKFCVLKKKLAGSPLVYHHSLIPTWGTLDQSNELRVPRWRPGRGLCLKFWTQLPRSYPCQLPQSSTANNGPGTTATRTAIEIVDGIYS